MDSLKIYEAVRVVPDNAKRTIQAGRLKGKTDINPMWRIKALTEQFGPCGIGWKYIVDHQWLEPGANNEVSAFVNISLYIKVDGEWSEAIPGTGGSAFVASEKSGLYTSDECYKMALTDAISVACKALGVGADVYWDADRTKYGGQNPQPPKEPEIVCACCKKPITPRKNDGKVYTPAEIAKNTKNTYGEPLCWNCATERRNAGIEGGEGV